MSFVLYCLRSIREEGEMDPRASARSNGYPTKGMLIQLIGKRIGTWRKSPDLRLFIASRKTCAILVHRSNALREAATYIVF